MTAFVFGGGASAIQRVAVAGQWVVLRKVKRLDLHTVS